MNSQVKPMTVEEWLAMGNQPKVLPMGYTANPNGIKKRSGPKVQYETHDERIEKDRKIKEQNEAIRNQKRLERQKAKAAAKAKAAQEKRLTAQMRAKERAKQAELKRIEREKAKAERLAAKLAAKKAKKVKLKLVVPTQLSKEYLRKQIVSMRAEVARTTGANRFIAPCKRHGETEYMTTGKKNTICIKCEKDRRASEISPDSDYFRKMANSEKRKAAIAAGHKEYLAVCRHHGETTYRMQSDKYSFCVECKKTIQKNFRNSNTPIAIARNAAIARGEREFLFACQYHGETLYRIRNDGASFCLTCKRNKDRKRTQALMKDPSLHQKKVERLAKCRALAEQGIFEFIDTCKYHGETRYKIERSAFLKKNLIQTRCLRCKYEKRNERKNAGDPVKRKQMTDALAKGEKSFISNCEKHGEVKYCITGNGTEYRCTKCRTVANYKTINKHKERYLSHPNTAELLNWYKAQPRGAQTKLAGVLGLSRIAISKFINGQAVIPDHHFETFKNWVSGEAA